MRAYDEMQTEADKIAECNISGTAPYEEVALSIVAIGRGLVKVLNKCEEYQATGGFDFKIEQLFLEAYQCVVRKNSPIPSWCLCNF